MKNYESLRGKDAEKWMDELWAEITNELAKKSNAKEINNILENLISQYEKRMILKRLGVAALSRLGMSYKKIGEVLWISPNTISTIKKNLLGERKNYKSYRFFYKGLTKWSASNPSSNKTTDAFEEIILLASKFFQPFMRGGLGITGASDLEVYRRKINGK